MLSKIVPGKQSLTWTEVGKLFLQQHSEYRHLQDYFSDLQKGADALVRGDSDALQVKDELSRAPLSSVCLFALSIPQSAQCYRDVCDIISKKLQDENFKNKADSIWMLCQELRPHMLNEALVQKMWRMSSLVSDADYEILRNCMSDFATLDEVLEKHPSLKNERKVKQIKEMISLVKGMTDTDPNLLKRELQVFWSVPRLICFALVLSQINVKGAHYCEWCQKLKAELNVQDLSLKELDRCLANWRHALRL